jgi:hypothetical protein
VPLVGEFHEKFWNLSDTVVPPVHIGRGGYPGWQAGSICPSLFGMLGAWIDARWELLKWHWRLAKRVHKLSREQKKVLFITLDLMESDAYVAAQKAVRATAVTLGFNRPEAWKQYSHAIKASPGRAENIFRHIRACELTREAMHSTMTNPPLNLVTELAYHGWAVKRDDS